MQGYSSVCVCVCNGCLFLHSYILTFLTSLLLLTKLDVNFAPLEANSIVYFQISWPAMLYEIVVKSVVAPCARILIYLLV
jgi:hypothetical protein